MIRFSENYSLKLHNTFGIDARAKYFFEFTEIEDLLVFFNSNESLKEEKMIVIGDGSNILFLNDFEGLVIHPNIPGIQIIKEDRQNIWMEVGAGEVWDEFVQYAVDYQFGGIENLSLIPGSVGAAPVQNIGAYGQEVRNVVEKVKGFDLINNMQGEFSAEQCEFEYRSSIFKRILQNSFIITSVIFRLEKFPEFILNYGQVEEKIKEKGEINLSTIREVVIEIRQSKLPDAKELGNAGSFFKNPVVDAELAEKLKTEFNTETGKGIRLMIESLQAHEPKLLSIENRQRKAIYTALKIFFNRDIGTRQSIFDYKFDRITDEIDFSAIRLKLNFILNEKSIT